MGVGCPRLAPHLGSGPSPQTTDAQRARGEELQANRSGAGSACVPGGCGTRSMWELRPFSCSFPRGSGSSGDECLPNRRGCPPVRTVDRWNLCRVQLLGDRLQRHLLPEHRVDPRPPFVVASVAEPMREADVVGRQVASVHLESRIVVGRRLPIRMRPFRLEVPPTPEAVALGHFAAHVDDLAIPGKLPEDSPNSKGLEPLTWSLLSVRRRWGPCLKDVLFVVQCSRSSPRRFRANRAMVACDRPRPRS